MTSQFPRKPIKWDYKKKLQFYAVDWIECDEVFDTHDDTFGPSYMKQHDKRFVIFAFGVTEEGYSVCVKINNYNPYFFVKIPENWKTEEQDEFINNFLNNDSIFKEKLEEYEEKADDLEKRFYPNTPEEKIVTPYWKSSFLETSLKTVEKEIFWTFSNHKKFKFWKIGFRSKVGMKLYHSYMKDNNLYPIDEDDYPDGKKMKFKLFESDLEPSLRFFHDSKIQPSNWIEINGSRCKPCPSLSSCQINLECNWTDVKSCDKTGIPPLIIASFDIECDSSHGDFPVAKKDCKKLANELVVCYLRDRYIIDKNPKESTKYKEAKIRLDTKSNYFSNRILQALSLKKNVVDEDISEIFLKNRDKLNSNIKSPRFMEMCENIYSICNRPIRKIQANQKMKEAMKIVDIRFEKLENKIAINNSKWKKRGIGKVANINDYINIISRTAIEKGIDFIQLRDKMLTKEMLVKFVNSLLNRFLPPVKGDRVIQIGTVFWRFGDDNPIHNHIITLDGCSDIPNVEEIISCVKEKDVLGKWSQMIKQYDPDIILGYNIFGFDESFMYDRALDLNPKATMNKNISKSYQDFINMGRLKEGTYSNIKSCQGRLINKKLSSSALGDNYLYYFNMPGRVQIDLLKVIQGGLTKLPSYKLDSVAEFYISGGVKQVGLDKENNPATSNWIKVGNISELNNGNYIIITMKTGEQLFGGNKIMITDINYETNYIKVNNDIPSKIMSASPTWGIGKDDVSPKDIFEFQKGTDDDRAMIAKYCIQDCALVIRLLKKLQTIPNNFGMSNVCLVPFNYIFMRGQGIKIFSLMVNECSLNGFLLPVLDKIRSDETANDDNDNEETELEETDTGNRNYTNIITENGLYKNGDDDDDDGGGAGGSLFDNNFNVIHMTDDGYEGAIVLVPKPGIYIGEPITVLDFSSLYPSEMIASNLSHDSHCENNYWLGDKGAKRIRDLGYDFKDVTYDVYSWIDPNNKNKGKHKVGETTERFIQYSDGKKGLVPQILRKLLGARKATKKRMKAESDPFKVSILDGLQLAYKVTANSLYGQIGASTSKIYKKAIAASTTAGGRRCIYRARDYVLKNNPGCEVVYGDTDSVFVKFNLVYEDGSYPTGYKEKIQRSMDIGLAIQQKLKDDKYFDPPHDLEYEKVFDPLMLITKKRYAGEKYEFDVNKSKFTSMGIVLKRRDNAPLLKYVYGGVMNKIMKEKDLRAAVQFVKDGCRDLLDDKFDLNMFIISKTLRDYYKDPESIAHKVLADRMADRDPGNKPASNERIPYAYIQVEEKEGVKLLQGDKIEHVNFIKENNCKIDYLTYIKNQLLKPICQIFELVVEKMKGYPYHKEYFQNLYSIYYDKYKGDIKKVDNKISELKQKVVAKLIFKPFLVEAYNKQHNINTLDNWLVSKNVDDIIDDVLDDEDVDNSTDNINKNEPTNIDITEKGKTTFYRKLKQIDINNFIQVSKIDTNTKSNSKKKVNKKTNSKDSKSNNIKKSKIKQSNLDKFFT